MDGDRPGGGLLRQAHFSREFRTSPATLRRRVPGPAEQVPGEPGFRRNSGPTTADCFLQSPVAPGCARSGNTRLGKGDLKGGASGRSDHAQRGVEWTAFIATERRGRAVFHEWYFSGDTPITEAAAQQLRPFRMLKPASGSQKGIGGVRPADVGGRSRYRLGPATLFDW